MEKTAQKLGPLTRLRETINVPSEKVMGLFSSQFVELMDKLREVDDNAREHASGLNNLLKVAKTNFNRREYMLAVSLLGQFHEKVEDIYHELSKLGTEVNIKHHEFLFGDTDPENIEYLVRKLGPKFERKKPALKRASIEKEAGIADWWYNVTSDRGRALSAWERSFPKRAKELKNQVASMISKSETLLKTLLDTLKTLGTLRATRNLEGYLKAADKFKQKYRAYDSTFSAFYHMYVKPFVDLQKDIMDKAQGEVAPVTGPAAPEVPAQEEKPTEQAPMHSKFVGEKMEKPEAPLPQQKPEDIKFPSEPKAKKQLTTKELMEKARELLKMKPATPSPHVPSARVPSAQSPRVPSTPDTEHEIEPTLVSPHSIRTTPKTLPIKPQSFMTQMPTEREEIEEAEPISLESPSTKRSPASPVAPKEKPIQVSMSYEKFINDLIALADSNPKMVSSELIKFATSIQNSDPYNSNKLMELAKNISEED